MRPHRVAEDERRRHRPLAHRETHQMRQGTVAVTNLTG